MTRKYPLPPDSTDPTDWLMYCDILQDAGAPRKRWEAAKATAESMQKDPRLVLLMVDHRPGIPPRGNRVPIAYPPVAQPQQATPVQHPDIAFLWIRPAQVKVLLNRQQLAMFCWTVADGVAVVPVERFLATPPYRTGTGLANWYYPQFEGVRGFEKFARHIAKRWGLERIRKEYIQAHQFRTVRLIRPFTLAVGDGWEPEEWPRAGGTYGTP